MSSENKGQNGRPEAELRPQPSKVQMAVVAGILALLAALVVLLIPGELHFRPAALIKYPAGCIKVRRRFVPTSVTAVPNPAIRSLPPQERNRVLLQANMRSCTCGCMASIISCHLNHSQCPAAKNLLRQAIARASGP
ncbi:MAG: hypothetical protein ACRD3O_05685 [Terriglobia bacterium]